MKRDPITSAPAVVEVLQVAHPAANRALKALEQHGILHEKFIIIFCRIGGGFVTDGGMTRYIMSIIGILASAHLSIASPESVETAKKELIAAMKAEDEAKVKAGPAGRGDSRLNYILNILETAMRRESQSYMESAFQSVVESYGSDGVRESVVKLREELNAGFKRAEAEELAACETLLKETRVKMLAAKRTEDLDPLLEGLENACKDRNSERAAKLQEVYQALRNAKRVVALWQDYLQAVAGGKGQAAVQALRNIASNDDHGPAFVPRSMVLARIQEQEGAGSGVTQIMSKVKELDDIAPAMVAGRRLRSIRDGYSSSNDLDAMVRAFSSLEKSYRNYKAGLPVELDLTSASSDSNSLIDETLIAGLRVKLLLLVLPRYIGAPEGTSARPGEDVLQFLARMGTEAKDRADGATALRARETANLLKRANTMSGTDTVGLKDYMAGLNQETAGQITQAVASYQRALKSGSDLIPAKQIGERLDALRKSGPTEYEEGMKLFLEPPASRYPEGMSSYMRSRMSSPYPEREAAPERPALLIPPPAAAKPDAPVQPPQAGTPAVSPKVETPKQEPSEPAGSGR